VLHFAADGSRCCILKILGGFPQPNHRGPHHRSSFLHPIAPFLHPSRLAQLL
jgi:hypothetical protein